MKTIIALHGNPGHTSDWDLLKKQLPTLEAFDPGDGAWIKRVQQGNDKKILIGHSWGTYKILKALPQVKNHIEKVILVAPYVKTERPLSFLASLLLRTPWLGSKLIQGNHRKAKAPFLRDLAFPASIEEKVFASVQTRMQDWMHWQKAAARKIAMQQDPLLPSEACETPLVILVAEQDRLSQWETQKDLFKNYPHCEIKIIPHAGHALPWLQPELIAAEALRRPIGYYPGASVDNNITSYMEKHLREFPERIALRWAQRDALLQWKGSTDVALPHDQITYKDFALRINSFAQGLLDIGIKPGERVIIFLPMSLDMYTAMFAVQRIGAIAVFLDSWARSHHLGASAECVEPKAMISFKMAFELVDQVPQFASMPVRILYGPGEKYTHRFQDLLKPSPAPIHPVESETTALITFTTGSTGKPKGANRTHRFLSAQHQALSHVIPYTPVDRDMPAFPIFSLNNLATGVTTILPAIDLSRPAETDSALLTNQIIHEKVNCTTLSPSMLTGVARHCLQHGIILKDLRRVVTGGAPISKDDVQSFYKIAPQTELWILYGSTEAEPMAHIEGREMLKEPSDVDPEIVEEGVNVGHISEDIDFKFIRIKDGSVELSAQGWAGWEVRPGEVGEFICTGDHVCRDYYNNPEAFHSTKIAGDDKRVWHRTGDLAYMDAQKNLWIVGRVNNAIERQGKYFFPVRAEVLLKRFPFTGRAAFLGLESPQGGQLTCAAVELKADIDQKQFDFATAKKEIQRVFEKNKIPLDQIHFVKSIPMDPRHHSKVEYKVLRDQLKDPGVLLA